MNLDGWIFQYFSENPPAQALAQTGVLLKKIGLGDTLAFFCILFGIRAYFIRDSRAMRASTAGVFALALSGIVVQTLKHIFGRARPPMNLGDFHFIGPNLVKNGFDSFPSGHAMSSFTLAAFFSYYYPKGRYAYIALGLAIALIGRVMLRDHYLSDVIVGAGIGWLFGHFMAKKSEKWVMAQEAGVPREAPVTRDYFEADSVSGVKNPNRLKAWGILALFSGAILFVGLGNSALWDRDETEYAQAVIEMEQSRNWLIPTLEGEPFIEKPILLYWVTYASQKAIGKSEWGWRFASALLGVISCLLTYEIGRALWGTKAGFFAGLILASSILYAGSLKLLMTDPLFINFSLLSLFFYILSWKKSGFASAGLLALSYASAGLAMMTKGPIGGFVVPIYLIFEFFYRRGSFKDFLFKTCVKHGLLTAIPVAIAAPWFLFSFSEQTQATSKFFIYDNLIRFLVGMEGHTGPTYYYVLILLAGFFPWFFFFVHWAVKDWRERRKTSQPISAETFLLCVWSLFLFVFFSISANKLPHYILPAMPAMAILIGKFWADQVTDGPVELRPSFAWTLGFSALLLVGPAAFLFAKRAHYLSFQLWLPFILQFAFAAAAFLFSRKREWRKSFYGLCAASFAFLLSANLFALPWIERFRVLKPIGVAIREKVPADAELVGYGFSEPSLFIYGGRLFPKVEHISLDEVLSRKNPVYVVVEEHLLKAQAPYEILAKASGFAENSGETTLLLIKNTR